MDCFNCVMEGFIVTIQSIHITILVDSTQVHAVHTTVPIVIYCHCLVLFVYMSWTIYYSYYDNYYDNFSMSLPCPKRGNMPNFVLWVFEQFFHARTLTRQVLAWSLCLPMDPIRPIDALHTLLSKKDGKNRIVLSYLVLPCLV